MQSLCLSPSVFVSIYLVWSPQWDVCCMDIQHCPPSGATAWMWWRHPENPFDAENVLGVGCSTECVANAFPSGHSLQTHHLVPGVSFLVFTNQETLSPPQTESCSEPQCKHSFPESLLRVRPEPGAKGVVQFRSATIVSRPDMAPGRFFLAQELTLSRAGQSPGAAVLLSAGVEGAELHPTPPLLWTNPEVPLWDSQS